MIVETPVGEEHHMECVPVAIVLATSYSSVLRYNTAALLCSNTPQQGYVVRNKPLIALNHAVTPRARWYGAGRVDEIATRSRRP